MAIDTSIPQIRIFQDWLRDQRGLVFDTYEDMWRWSVTDLESFWQSIWDYHEIVSPTPHERVLSREEMPGAVWFDGAQANYARQVLRHVEPAEAAGQCAIIAENELGEIRELSWPELKRQVASLALTLRGQGIVQGDRVVAYLPNGAEAVIAFLACASLGATWSVCAPDMGLNAIVDRFRQIEPKALIAADGVYYAGKAMDRTETITSLLDNLPTVESTIIVRTPQAAREMAATVSFDVAVSREGADVDAFEPEWLPFDHPLWVLYSSGTTGLPKALVHSHGGVVMMALAGGKHMDLGASYEPNTFGERFHWYSSTGWVMWNAQIGGLLGGTTICLYDGSPSGTRDNPDWGVLLRFSARHKVTYFGAGAAFYSNCMKSQLVLSECGDLSRIRAIGSTGSPLPPDVQAWGSEQFASIGTPDIWWNNISGGTDICANFVSGNRELPVVPGKMQCRQLGVATEAWNEQGEAVVGETGELVCSRPMPSMPIYLWGDDTGERYLSSYFHTYPGVWSHGDWLTVWPDGSCTISGRSDATINRHGVRMGTSEIYSAIEALPEVLDSLVVELSRGSGDTILMMFVVPAGGAELDDGLLNQIKTAIRTSLSPRFIPDVIVAAPAIPRTLSGKKQELPIKRLFEGWAVEKVINRDAMTNPEVLAWYQKRAADHIAGGGLSVQS